MGRTLAFPQVDSNNKIGYNTLSTPLKFIYSAKLRDNLGYVPILGNHINGHSDCLVVPLNLVRTRQAEES